MTVESLLKQALESGASDLHIKAYKPPLLRIHDELIPMGLPALSAEEARDLALSLLNREQQETFVRNLELDLSDEIPGLTRYRANLLYQRGAVSAVIRLIPNVIRSLDELGAPPTLKELAMRPRGLLLVTGPTGSGKTTTQAALIDYINAHQALHIITVEDPIEYIHEDKIALVNQREVGSDTQGFASALKYVLRQDPDVILIGEMRTLETIALAVTAAETGHLVIGTLHTPDAIQAVDRMIDVFPPYQQPQIRTQLANNLLGVVCQRLVRSLTEGGRLAIFEMLVAVPAMKGLIRENKTHQIRSLIHSGGQFGMQTAEQHLAELVLEGKVSLDDALEVSLHPGDLRKILQTRTPSVKSSHSHPSNQALGV